MRIGITFFSISFADSTTFSSNNFDLNAIYTSTILLTSLWLFFHCCPSVCRVMGIGINLHKNAEQTKKIKQRKV